MHLVPVVPEWAKMKSSSLADFIHQNQPRILLQGRLFSVYEPALMKPRHNTRGGWKLLFHYKESMADAIAFTQHLNNITYLHIIPNNITAQQKKKKMNNVIEHLLYIYLLLRVIL